jgi:hypothetical protein
MPDLDVIYIFTRASNRADDPIDPVTGEPEDAPDFPGIESLQQVVANIRAHKISFSAKVSWLAR